MSSDSPQKLPPGLVLYRMAIGHYVSRALDLVARLGIADLLASGPLSAGELAAKTDTDAAALRRVLCLLASVDVFTETDDGAFALTEVGTQLRSDVPGSSRAQMQLFAGVGIQDAWRELEYCVRTGQPAFRKDSPDADAFSGMDAEATRVFDEAMATFAPATSAAMAAAYDFSQFGTVMDVGGGNGAILLGLLGANPAVHGIVFEREGAAARAQEKIASEGLEARCTAVAGDFFDAVPGDADALILKHVIHDWEDEKAIRILSNCRRSMKPGATVLIAEGVYPARIDGSLESRGATANDVNMLVVSGGRQRSEAEFRALYEASGFELTRVVHTAARLALIEGKPR
jgi:SAM-dependent methyltransferase